MLVVEYASSRRARSALKAEYQSTYDLGSTQLSLLRASLAVAAFTGSFTVRERIRGLISSRVRVGLNYKFGSLVAGAGRRSLLVRPFLGFPRNPVFSAVADEWARNHQFRALSRFGPSLGPRGALRRP